MPGTLNLGTALARLHTTFCPLELEAIRQAGQTLLQFYRDVATKLATSYHIPYPTALDRVMAGQSEQD